MLSIRYNGGEICYLATSSLLWFNTGSFETVHKTNCATLGDDMLSDITVCVCLCATETHIEQLPIILNGNLRPTVCVCLCLRVMVSHSGCLRCVFIVDQNQSAHNRSAYCVFMVNHGDKWLEFTTYMSNITKALLGFKDILWSYVRF